MKRVQRISQFGEAVEGFPVPVLNEREVRASAGIMFLVLLIALVQILFRQDFLLVKYVIVVFLTDFILRVFVSPRFSPLLIIGRLIVSRQVPEYVGAPPKKFAWTIGLVLSCLMFFLLVVLNSYSIITGVTCLICLFFLFFESAFGICLGCLFYRLFYKDEARYCAGEVCSVKEREAIQHTSWAQVLVVVGAVVSILLAVVLFNDHFRVPPKSLKEVISSR
jgi:hypothetical protein